MQIGLIGGIGPAAQDYYTRALIAVFAQAGAALDMTTVYTDSPTLLGHLARGEAVAQADIFARLTARLALAGAGCVAVTSIAGHFCRAEFAARSPLPVVDLISAVADDVAARGLDRIGILGTRTVMQSRFYGGLAGVTVVAPAELDAVHDAYVAMAASGTISAEQRALFTTAAEWMLNEHEAQAILLGGTDLALAFDEATCPFALVDCAGIHARAIARYAVEHDAIRKNRITL